MTRLQAEREERDRKRTANEAQAQKERTAKEKTAVTSQVESSAQKEAEEILKERKEQQQKLKSLEKRVDYYERAKRLTEIPLIEKMLPEKQVQDKEFWEKHETTRIEQATAERKNAVAQQERLKRMLADRDVFADKLKAERNTVYVEKVRGSRSTWPRRRGSDWRIGWCSAGMSAGRNGCARRRRSAGARRMRLGRCARRRNVWRMRSARRRMTQRWRSCACRRRSSALRRRRWSASCERSARHWPSPGTWTTMEDAGVEIVTSVIVPQPRRIVTGVPRTPRPVLLLQLQLPLLLLILVRGVAAKPRRVVVRCVVVAMIVAWTTVVEMTVVEMIVVWMTVVEMIVAWTTVVVLPKTVTASSAAVPMTVQEERLVEETVTASRGARTTAVTVVPSAAPNGVAMPRLQVPGMPQGTHLVMQLEVVVVVPRIGGQSPVRSVRSVDRVTHLVAETVMDRVEETVTDRVPVASAAFLGTHPAMDPHAQQSVAFPATGHHAGTTDHRVGIRARNAPHLGPRTTSGRTCVRE